MSRLAKDTVMKDNAAEYSQKKSMRIFSVSHVMMLLTTVLFVTLFFIKGAGAFGDTNSYAYMGIDVLGEPAYPLLMTLFRCIFGESIYFSAIAFFQTLLAIFSICFFVDFLIKRFSPAAVFQVLMYAVMWAFYIMPGFFSTSGVMTFLAMLTEGLAYPLFFVFLVFLLKGVMDLSFKDWFIAVILDSFIILVRTQLFFALITAIIAGVYIFVKTAGEGGKAGAKMPAEGVPGGMKTAGEGGKAGAKMPAEGTNGGKNASSKMKLALKMVGTIALGLLIIRLVSVVYAYAVTGSFETITTKSGFYANTMYLAEKEDANLFEDEFTGELFKERYRDIGEWGWGIRYYEGNNIIDAALDVEYCHDYIKEHMSMGYYFDENGITDPVTKFKMQNDMAGTFASKLLSAHFGRFIYNYLGMALVGLIRTVAVSPASILMQIYTIVVYVLLALALILNRRNRPMFCMLWVTVVGVLVNAFETAAVIMVLSRYALYMFPMVYISLLLAFSELIKRRKHRFERDWKGLKEAPFRA